MESSGCELKPLGLSGNAKKWIKGHLHAIPRARPLDGPAERAFRFSIGYRVPFGEGLLRTMVARVPNRRAHRLGKKRAPETRGSSRAYMRSCYLVGYFSRAT